SFLFVEKSWEKALLTRNSDILKITDDGNIVWDKQIKNQDGIYRLSDIIKTENGFLLTGYMHDSITKKADLLVLKILDNGTYEWSKYYGSALNDYGNKIINTSNGNYLV